ncbi:MAG: PilZ domain-containing protein [Kofleriaceae bacterium]|nr:PilZ domain-containing protein [Kofleriaceae bacterium]
MRDLRRVSPRIDVEALCWEVVGERESSALIVDLSSEGARVERPYVGGRIETEVPLQLELPGIDEVMWARGDVVFDRLVPAKTNGGPFGLIRRTGYRIAIAAARDLRLLRDYVYEMHRIATAANDDLAYASCYMRG